MLKTILLKAAVIALLVAAAMIGHQTSISVRSAAVLFAPGLLLFGIVNVLFAPTGTHWVRTFAVAATIAALLWPEQLRTAVALLAWLVWPPAFMVAWGLARYAAAGPGVEQPEGDAAAARARFALSAFIAAVAVGSLAYRILVAQGVQQTAALFVGIPAFLAVAVVYGVSPRSATGVACKAVTVGLLVSLLFLGEGILCVAMSAPLFFAVAVIVAAMRKWASRRNEKAATTLFSSFVVLALVPMSLEGVTSYTTLNRDETVAISRIIRASPQAVERALLAPPRFERLRPLYLRAGFPSPVSTRIDRSSNATRWIIRLRGGEMRLDGMEPRAGDLILQLEEARAGLVRWRAVSDSSHMTHFLSWREAIVEWEPVGADTTRVTWTLRYRRDLDPSWYFGPWERYAARLAAGYLIEAVATP
jgi:hypothetical protein